MNDLVRWRGDRGARGDPPDYEPVLLVKGAKGETGLPGLAGERGARGPTGDDGRDGSPGARGETGARGFDGLRGIMGKKGGEGSPGLRGSEGGIGVTGSPGPIGHPGDKGRIAPNRGYFFTKHSQTTQVPACPADSGLMWSGYSLLYIMGNERAVGQDLGEPGSCLRLFSTMPYMFCDIKESCHIASRNDYSYWLSTPEPLTPSLEPIAGRSIEKYISRCAVCESRTKVIAIHSQGLDIPSCPRNWEGLWVGYSFLMNTDSGGEGNGQPLSSPGSCLQDFRPNPFIECQGHGRCNAYTTAYSFWLASIDTRTMFSVPKPETLKPGQLKSKVSRCQVCRRKPIEIRRTVITHPNLEKYNK